MKIQKKTAKLSLLAIVLVISFTIPILAVTAKNEAWYLEPLIIDDAGGGDYTWETAAEEPWCTGSGTPDDPYIIKDIIINGVGSSNCMVIRNSVAHFKIMKCKFYGANEPYGTGLLLNNVQNGVIFKNQFLDNGLSLPMPWGLTGAGISLIYSHNNIIKKNTVLRNVAVGIYLDDADNNEVVDNYCSESNWGIMLFTQYGYGPSEDNLISRNDCVDNGEAGIILIWAYRNTITKNLCSDNSGNGILLVNYAMYNTIEDNICKGNSFGVSIGVNSHFNDVLENDIIENSQYGVVLWTESPTGGDTGPVYYTNIYHNNFIDNTIQASDASPWANNWNENYWSDYPGTDIDGDGLGDTDLPWPMWSTLDYTPFVEKNGWDDDNLQEDVIHAFISGEQRFDTTGQVSVSELNYLIVASAETISERRYFMFGPPYTWQVRLDGEEIELSSFWWDDKEGEKIGQPAFMRIYYHIFEPYSLQDLELGLHTLEFEASYYAGWGPYRYLVTGGWSSQFELVE
ncbi:MAG: right-handed parallel beta-helix repeat-containing protein [Promethearchaeota archaeon]|jgi:parallel beta-helix repeat protein